MRGPTDLELLQRHEPLLRFTYGELFFPMAAAAYVEHCDLLEGPTLREARVAVPDGSSWTSRPSPRSGDPPPGQAQFLRFVPHAVRRPRARAVAKPSGSSAVLGAGPAGPCRPCGAAGRCRPGHVAAAPRPRPGRHRGRGGRALRRDPGDAIRGSSTTAASIREGRWVVLHYLFFYAMNDWRSTFEGANDHEADWEQCFVVLEALDNGRRCSRPGSARRPTTRRATTCDDAGTTRASRSARDIRSSTPAPARTRPTSSAASTSCGCPFPGERNIRGPARPPAAAVARHPRPARPGRSRRQGPPGPERPVRRLRPR